MIKFKPESLNDTTRMYPRTLREAFPSSPQWQDEAPLHDKVLYAIGIFCIGFLTALLVFS
jgi:hypothetical protein